MDDFQKLLLSEIQDVKKETKENRAAINNLNVATLTDRVQCKEKCDSKIDKIKTEVNKFKMGTLKVIIIALLSGVAGGKILISALKFF